MKLLSSASLLVVSFSLTTTLAATITLYNVVDPSVQTSLPFTVPSPSVTIHAIGTASSGETTYAVEEVESVYVDVGIFTKPVTSNGKVYSDGTVPFTYTTDPLTISGIIVEDATHKVVDLTYPTGSPFGDVLHDHEDCTFDANGAGSCVGVIEQVVAGSSTSTFTLTGTGTLSPIYTITATDVVPTSTTSAKTNAALPSGPRFVRESCIGWGLFAVSTFSAWVLLL